MSRSVRNAARLHSSRTLTPDEWEDPDNRLAPGKVFTLHVMRHHSRDGVWVSLTFEGAESVYSAELYTGWDLIREIANDVTIGRRNLGGQ